MINGVKTRNCFLLLFIENDFYAYELNRITRISFSLEQKGGYFLSQETRMRSFFLDIFIQFSWFHWREWSVWFFNLNYFHRIYRIIGLMILKCVCKSASVKLFFFLFFLKYNSHSWNFLFFFTPLSRTIGSVIYEYYELT